MVLCLGALLVMLGVWYRWWRQQHVCPEHRLLMPMLSEADDDRYLESGERVEESLGSIDYQVFFCPHPECDHIRTFRVEDVFSDYRRCPDCKFMTRSSTQTTQSYPTEKSTGSATVHEKCGHCDYALTYQVTLLELGPPAGGRLGSLTQQNHQTTGNSDQWGSGGLGGPYGGGGLGPGPF